MACEYYSALLERREVGMGGGSKGGGRGYHDKSRLFRRTYCLLRRRLCPVLRTVSVAGRVDCGDSSGGG